MTVWTSDERRARWERSVATKEAAGFPVERDPRFLAWIEAWIAGEITMPEVQRRYANWMSTRGAIAIERSTTPKCKRSWRPSDTMCLRLQWCR